MEELIQIEGALELWLVREGGAQSTLKVVQFFDGLDARDCKVWFALLCVGAKHRVEDAAYERIGQLGLEIALTIQSRRFHIGFRLVISYFKKNTIGGDLLAIADLDDVAHQDLRQTSIFKLEFVFAVSAIERAIWRSKAFHRSRVDFFVVSRSFELGYELINDSDAHDDNGWSNDNDGHIDLDGFVEVEDTSDDVEDVDHLAELQREGDREESQPGVPSRLSLVRWRHQLALQSLAWVEVWRHTVRVELSSL